MSEAKEWIVKNDGGPAFPEAPVSIGSLTTRMRPGMTLRDWFAGMAMQGILSHLGCLDTAKMKRADGTDLGVTSADSISKAAYGYADAMLKARESQ